MPEWTFIWRRVQEVRKWRRHRGWIPKGVRDRELGASRGWAKKAH